ncbi:MAG: hypothetical protein WCV00_06495 [Verrucomicrobiia bacterium]|jgi:argininosuccinate synthase
MTAGHKSDLSLYQPDIARMESGESIYNQDDATGFIELQRPPSSREGDGREAGEAEDMKLHAFVSSTAATGVA